MCWDEAIIFIEGKSKPNVLSPKFFVVIFISLRFIHLELGRSLIWGQLFHVNYVELSSVLNESSTNEKRNPIKSLWLRSLRYLQPLGIKCLCNYTCNSNSLCTHHKLKLIIEHSTAIYSHFKRENLARLTRQSFTVSTL